MKKLIAIALVLASTSTFAHGYYYRGGWVAPAVIGAAVGYELARPRYYYQPAPQVVYVQPQQPVYVQQPYYNNGYHQETILDANCNCYRTVWVQN